jgi:predicted N-formylglutamate amidohydrolase
LLGGDDLAPALVMNEGGGSPFLLIGDHAGRAVPRALGGLGLPSGAMDLHIAWDIGVAGLGARLASVLDACFIQQTYSRLVIDCNRRPSAADGAPAVSDGVIVPGNAALGAVDMTARVEAIHRPYQTCISEMLDAREGRGQASLLVSLHSFTPALQGVARPWRFGVLHRGDSVLSNRMLALLKDVVGDEAGDNQPYAMDKIDYTVPFHADARGIDYLELETRQDLIADEAGQTETAALIARLLAQVAQSS